MAVKEREKKERERPHETVREVQGVERGMHPC